MPKKLTAKQKRSKEKYAIIRADYKMQTEVKHLDSAFVCRKLGTKHHYAAETIWAIIKKIGYYKTR